MTNVFQYFLILVPGAVWGASFIVTRLILPHMPPLTIGFARTLISAIFLLTILSVMGGRVHRDWREWRAIAVLSVCNTTAFVASAWGQLFITGGLATILAATIPFFTLIVAHFATDDDKINRWRSLGIAMGLIGVIILVGVGALAELGASLKGQFALLFSSLCYGFGGVLTRFLLARQPVEESSSIPRLRVMAMQFTTGMVLLTPFMLVIDRPWTLDIPVEVFGYLLFLGIGVTTFATMIFYYLTQTLGATTTSRTMYIIPISGVALGVWILGEEVTWTMPIALRFIFGGVWMISRPSPFAADYRAQ